MTVMAYTSMGQIHMVKDIAPKNLSRKVYGDTSEIHFRNQGNANGWSLIFDSIMWNSSARIEKNESPDTKDDNPHWPWETKGNVTESGIFKFFMNLLKG